MGSYGRNFSFRVPPPSLYQIQAWLTGAGYHQGPIDGTLGPYTQQALRSFQVDVGLDADGELGPKTYEALRRAGAGVDEGAIERARTVLVGPEDMAMARAGLVRALALLEED